MQLKFNNDFNDILENITDYKKLDDLNIKKFIEEILDKQDIYDLDKDEHVCIKCKSTLKNGICENCNKKYNLKNKIYEVCNYELYDNYLFTFFVYYFDIQETLLLYRFEIKYNINNQNYDIKINNVYQITNLGLYDLVTEESIVTSLISELNFCNNGSSLNISSCLLSILWFSNI